MANKMLDLGSIERKFNSFTREWHSIQNGSLKSVNAILALISKLNLVKTKQYFEDLNQFPDISDRLVAIIIDQINLKLPELLKSLNELKRLVERVKNWEEVTSRVIINEMQSSFLNQLPDELLEISDIRIMEQTLEQIKEIVFMFETEVSLRDHIYNLLLNIKDQFNVQKVNVFLTIWTSEPYIDFNRINEILESFSDLSIEESNIKSEI